MSAVYRTLSSQSSNLDTSSNNLGVFLNQTQGTGTYYVARARQSIVTNLVIFEFSSWSCSPSGSVSFLSSSKPETGLVFNQSNATANANYTILKPCAPDSVWVGGSTGDYIHITWQEHPSSLVTKYQIWRTVKPLGGNPSSPALIATLNKGTTSFIDYDYVVTETYSDNLIKYDVRAVIEYGASTYYSDPVWYSIFGRIEIKIAAKPDSAKMQSQEAFNTAILSASPNPFNPSTNIRFVMSSSGSVRLTLHDLLGREVRTVLDGPASAGEHILTLNAGSLASGSYFLRIIQRGSSESPHTRTIRLLLSK
jgi:hypothetical protein